MREFLKFYYLLIRFLYYLFKPLLKYGFLVIIFIIVSILLIALYENIMLDWKEKVFIEREKNKFKEQKIDIDKYDLNVTDFNGSSCYFVNDSCKWYVLRPEYRYFLGEINENGLRDGVGENYEYIYFENIKNRRWIIGEWKNDTISGQAIEISDEWWHNDSSYLYIRYVNYPNDTLSSERLHNYDLLITNARQWAIENIDF